MNHFAAYEKILTRSCMMIVGICIFVIAIIAIAYPFVKKQYERNEQKIVALICGLFVLGALIIGGYTAYNTISDIQKQSYIVYSGTFVSDKDGTGKVHIVDSSGKKITLSVASYTMPFGTYSGKIVYSEKTKIVLEYQIYN
ncbi:MAG: hypothetical protein IKJ35_03325 [Clostridia bacterium]|nr:hypothetical protein [Clostridia bacterium]